MTFSYSDNDRRLMRAFRRIDGAVLEAAGAKELWVERRHRAPHGRLPDGRRPRDSVVDKDGRSWSNPATCGFATVRCFPTSGGVNPSLTIQALACRMGDRIADMAKRGEL